MPETSFVLLDEENVADIPEPVAPGARCRSCDYWERLDGGRAAPEDGAEREARDRLKRHRLLPGRAAAGPYGMLAYRATGAERVAVGWAQFGPLSQYPRAQSIRDRYPGLPDSPAPWVVTCLQVVPNLEGVDRPGLGAELLEAVCAELDRRGITALESFPERAGEPWLPSPGPATVYEAAGFTRVAGDDRYPVYRRELSGETDADAWSDLLRAAAPDGGDDWPLPMPSTPDADDFFRLPPDKPARRNPFGDD